MRFWLGTHRTGWLARAGVPLFVSHRTLRERVRLPVAAAPWCLDSGAFTELNRLGRFETGAQEYLDAVKRYAAEVGSLEWAAPQDWMCEPWVVERTGLSVREHQERTVQNYLDLRREPLVIPVLQGWELADYLRCADLYAQAGVDLASLPLVGVGSVCRRQSTAEIASIMRELGSAGIALHGFGVKIAGLRLYGPLLASADSMAWSFGGRMRDPDLHPGCAKKACNNCIEYAMAWRARVLEAVPA